MALPKLTRKYLLLAKIEGVYGTDPTPTAASNAVLVENLKVKPAFDALDRNNVALPDLSKLPHLIGKYWAEISFDVELKGSADTDGDVPPDFGCLLRACSMAENIVAGPGGSVTYLPESDSQESVTIYCNKDGQMHKFVGCVGSWKMAGEVGKPIMISFELKGKLKELPSDVALETPTLLNLEPPLVLGATFSYGGWAPPLSKFSLDIKNKLVERPDVHESSGVMGFFVADREPEGSFDPEANTLATRNIWSNLQTVNEAALSIVIGSVAGNRCTIAAPKCAKKNVEWGDRDGIATYDISFGIYRNAGNDEISIAFT